MLELHSSMNRFEKLNKAGIKKKLIRVSPVDKFEEITAFLLE